MARYKGPKCRLCRREGVKLFLKGPRCDTVKCPIARRNARPPGVHTWRRSRVSPFGLGLREKQKAKRFYGILERQLRTTFKKASIKKGNTGEHLLQHLESRLDNVVFLLGYALSRNQARQFVRHGHILLNEKRATIPSMLVRKGDTIQPSKREKSKKLAKESIESYSREVPAWLGRDDKTLIGTVIELPRRENVTLDIKESLIVELLSR